MLNVKKVRLMANNLVTTKDVYTADEVKKGGLFLKIIGSLKEYQKVVAVGPMVRGIKEGDLVCINPRRYAQYKHPPGSLKDGVITDNPVVQYNFNVIEINHVPHLLLTDNDIDFIIEEYTDENPPAIDIPEKKILT